VLACTCQPATSVDHLCHPIVTGRSVDPVRDDQGPDHMLRFDNHIDDDVGLGAIDPLNRRQWQ
jgi:hypothetical protein